MGACHCGGCPAVSARYIHESRARLHPCPPCSQAIGARACSCALGWLLLGLRLCAHGCSCCRSLHWVGPGPPASRGWGPVPCFSCCIFCIPQLEHVESVLPAHVCHLLLHFLPVLLRLFIILLRLVPIVGRPPRRVPSAICHKYLRGEAGRCGVGTGVSPVVCCFGGDVQQAGPTPQAISRLQIRVFIRIRLRGANVA